MQLNRELEMLQRHTSKLCIATVVTYIDWADDKALSNKNSNCSMLYEIIVANKVCIRLSGRVDLLSD